jgi:hypothetical protein
MQLIQRRLMSMFLSHRVYRCAQLFSLTITESHLNLQRNAAAGAPKTYDDLVPDEYFDSSNPDSQQHSTSTQIDSGEHGRLCFCL